ncbi:MAG: type II toxin-antitoxin system Phd/YefM family antitoxin [Bryobacteraceae bacterium]
MATVSSSEARNRWGELLDRAAQGETIMITRRGKTVARMVPEVERSMEKIRRAVESIRARAARWRSGKVSGH